MKQDPIVEEIHQVRQKMLAECQGDLDQLLDRLQAAEPLEGDRMVSLEAVRERRPREQSRQLTLIRPPAVNRQTTPCAKQCGLFFARPIAPLGSVDRRCLIAASWLRDQKRPCTEPLSRFQPPAGSRGGARRVRLRPLEARRCPWAVPGNAAGSACGPAVQ